MEVREGSCPQLAEQPSCARVFFTSAEPAADRAGALEDAARAAGWEWSPESRAPTGSSSSSAVRDTEGFAAIWEDERAVACHQDPDTDCADELQVFEDV